MKVFQIAQSILLQTNLTHFSVTDIVGCTCHLHSPIVFMNSFLSHVTEVKWAHPYLILFGVSQSEHGISLALATDYFGTWPKSVQSDWKKGVLRVR